MTFFNKRAGPARRRFKSATNNSFCWSGHSSLRAVDQATSKDCAREHAVEDPTRERGASTRMNHDRKRASRHDCTNNRLKRDVEDILSDVNSAVTTKQRLLVLSRIERLVASTRTAETTVIPFPSSESAHPPVEERCNDVGANFEPDVVRRCLVEGGVLSALLMQMNFILQRHGTTNKEIDQLLVIIHLLTRNCPGEIRQQVAAQLESSSFLDLLAKSVKNQPITLNVARLLHTVSKSSAGSHAILKYNSLILPMAEALAMIRDNIDSEEFLLETLGCIKNITCYAEDDRATFACQPGMISALTSICLQRHLPPKVAERMSAVFRNLLLSQECRRIVPRDPSFVNALLELSIDQNNPRVLRNILNILHNLSLDGDASLMFVMYGDGVFLNVLMELLGDDDAVIRRRSVRTFRLWTNEETAPLLVHRQDVMNMLSDRALHDENQCVRSEAAEAFSKCAGLVHADEPHHRTVLQALVALSRSRGVSSEIVGRAFREQAGNPDNRIALGGDLELVKMIAHTAVAPESSLYAREDACCALRDLATEWENCRAFGNDRTILDALVQNAEAPTYERSQRRRFAIESLVQLSNEPTVRPSMVKHDRLLKSLIHFASTADAESTHELKRDVKQTILVLVKVL